MRLPLLCCGALVAANSYAEPASQVLAYSAHAPEEMIVTASRSQQALKNTLASTTLISRQDIERSQARDMQQLLRSIPGVTIRRNGGPGGATNLSMRGGDASGTLILVDGIKVGSATLGETALEQLSVDQIERIEIIRGPKSSLYGSSAMNGVVQIFTRRAHDTSKAQFTVAAGDDGTQEGTSSASAVGGSTRFNITGTYVTANGFDARYDDDAVSGLYEYDKDEDSYDKKSVAINLEQALGEVFSVSLIANQAEGENEYDIKENPAWVADPGLTLPYSNFETSTYVAALNMVFQSFSSKFSYGIYEDRAEQKDSAPNRFTDTFIETERTVGQWENSVKLHSTVTLNFGTDYEVEEVDSTGGYSVDNRDNLAGYTNLLIGLGAVSFSGGVRHENNDQFGSKWTGDTSLGLEVADGATLSVSYGTAFKAPTFNDLYWPTTLFAGGNEFLQPELTETYEIGFDVYQDWGFTSLHVYKSFVDNLIEWATADGFFWQPSNVSSTKHNGVEFQYGTTVMNTDVAIGLTYEKALDESTDEDLQRRPRRTASITLDRSYGDVSVGTTLYGQGQHYDDSLGGRQVVPGFVQVDIRAAWQINDNVRLRARIDNLFDYDIVETFGYNTSGIFPMVGLDVTIP